MTDPAAFHAFDPAMFRERTGHAVALGIRYAGHGDDWVELTLPYDRRLISDVATGILASGPIVSLFDSTMGAAVMTRTGIYTPATLDLRVDYLRPARPGETVVARAECYRTTRRIAFVRAMAHDGDPGQPIAHSTATFVLAGASTP